MGTHCQGNGTASNESRLEMIRKGPGKTSRFDLEALVLPDPKRRLETAWCSFRLPENGSPVTTEDCLEGREWCFSVRLIWCLAIKVIPPTFKKQQKICLTQETLQEQAKKIPPTIITSLRPPGITRVAGASPPTHLNFNRSFLNSSPQKLGALQSPNKYGRKAPYNHHPPTTPNHIISVSLISLHGHTHCQGNGTASK
ncbi:hypothetical protein CEXT_253821 [Caerostris extrusa]|uniref:Uncharacterized protein n=1 Tax=Caerostris extrusa TaxID=172846 RepID=A0AAV4XAR1_CAEEX|nr:hypothetical protein CEXT_253821 [Caerostris extrusa]